MTALHIGIPMLLRLLNNKSTNIQNSISEMDQICNSLSNMKIEDDNDHPWMKREHISDAMLDHFIRKIKDGSFTPANVFHVLNNLNYYITTNQLRKIQTSCSEMYANYQKWYLYDHALCARVTDRWNLTPRYRAEGYYYCDKNQKNPPYNWMAMQLDNPFLY